MRSTAYAKRTLEAGFTTIRNVGAEGGADVALKRAIDDGLVPGPRIWTARHTLSITGGHGDQGGLRPDLGHDATWQNGIVDTPEEAAKAVRYQHKYGADLIKFTATGGVLSIGDSGDLQQFSDDEMRQHRQDRAPAGNEGRRARARQSRASKRPSRLASIRSSTAPTWMPRRSRCSRSTARIWCRRSSRGRPSPRWRRSRVRSIRPCATKAAKIGPLMQDSFRRAYAGGVKIAFGTDSGVSNHGDNAREFGYMVEAGMPPMEAILSATRSAADLLGASDRVGSLQAGRFADVIAVSGDPLKDITELQRITFVMKGGIVYKQAAAQAAVDSWPAAPMTSLAAGMDFVDLRFLGRPGIIATAILQGPSGVALVDPGPSSHTSYADQRARREGHRAQRCQADHPDAHPSRSRRRTGIAGASESATSRSTSTSAARRT